MLPINLLCGLNTALRSLSNRTHVEPVMNSKVAHRPPIGTRVPPTMTGERNVGYSGVRFGWKADVSGIAASGADVSAKDLVWASSLLQATNDADREIRRTRAAIGNDASQNPILRMP